VSIRRFTALATQLLRRQATLATALIVALGLVGCVLLGRAPQVRAVMPSSSPPKFAGDWHIVLLTLDGVRGREVFRGSDLALVRAQRVPVALHRSARELMPNLHDLMERTGTVIGDPASGSRMFASGPNFVSLPGYAEVLSGRRVTACRDNGCQRSEAPTVLDDCAAVADTLHDCAAVTSWPSIGRVVALNPTRVAISTGRHGGTTRAAFTQNPVTELLLGAGARQSSHPGHGDFRPDARTAQLAVRYFDTYQPRLLFIGLGEPDEYAHRNDYANYLRSLRAADELIGDLSRKLSTLAARGARTALFITTDHGRADSFVSHGAKHPESAQVWLVAAGTGIAARGIQRGTTRRFLADIAPTMRHLLSLPADAHPHAGQPLAELIEPRPEGPGLVDARAEPGSGFGSRF
jgi:hypothetical protein